MANKCSFCGNPLPFGSGKLFVKNDGRQLFFCSSKCDTNFQMGREGKKMRWTATAHQLKKKK
ncbi:MAG TPA: 50S ribosomal protein L24e [archaeon]|nr:50S ribosomal protein L24e [archaeon]